MSRTTALAVTPNRRPLVLAEFRNAHGWSPSIWGRLARQDGLRDDEWFTGDAWLNRLWREIEELPEWTQAPLVLTFDTGVIPYQAYEWAADNLDEFDRRLPALEGRINHIPAIAELLRQGPEAPFFGTWGTSVSENPFDPWDIEADAPGSGIPIGEMYVLERHRHLLP